MLDSKNKNNFRFYENIQNIKADKISFRNNILSNKEKLNKYKINESVNNVSTGHKKLQFIINKIEN